MTSPQQLPAIDMIDLQQIMELGKRANNTIPPTFDDPTAHELAHAAPIMAQQLLDLLELCEEADEWAGPPLINVERIRTILERQA